MSENIRFSLNQDGIAELVFDLAEVKVNLLTERVMTELDVLLSDIEKNPLIKMLIIQSSKKDIFIAGADIQEIADIRAVNDAENKSRMGQAILNHLSQLPFPTLCVIDGVCLGGGFELALACTYRMVTDNKKVQIGLPEVSLGIIPGFGGTQRLPRLAGLTEALSMITSGRTIDGKKAYKLKIADFYCYQEFQTEKTTDAVHQILDDKKRKLLLNRRQKKPLLNLILENTPVGRMLVYHQAKKEILKKTRGFYPAPLAALNVIRKTFHHSLKKGLIQESRAFGSLAVTPVAKKLIRLFFTNEAMKKEPAAILQSAGGRRLPEIRKVGLLGAGKMGGGIAWLFSNADMDVRMKEISWEMIGKGMKAVEEIYSSLRQIRKLDEREIGLKIHRITGTLDYSGFDQCDFVIEAIVEDKEAKIKALSELEAVVGDQTIIATNTSSLSLRELSAGLKKPERLIGFHFFNPVNRMPLIEIVKGEATSDSTILQAFELARKIRKTPVLVNDCNGFLVNRILLTYLDEALKLFEEGVNLKQIDRLIYEFGFPMGPFALFDEIGIKVGYKIAKIMSTAYQDKVTVSSLFDQIGKDPQIIGRTSSKGFYLYQGKRKILNPEINRILKTAGHSDIRLKDEAILDRCLLRMINEAAFCLQEGIIARAEYLDMALLSGIAFPPFIGGILRYADDLGIDQVVSKLVNLQYNCGYRFQPCPLLVSMKEKKERFYP